MALKDVAVDLGNRAAGFAQRIDAHIGASDKAKKAGDVIYGGAVGAKDFVVGNAEGAKNKIVLWHNKSVLWLEGKIGKERTDLFI